MRTLLALPLIPLYLAALAVWVLVKYLHVPLTSESWPIRYGKIPFVAYERWYHR